MKYACTPGDFQAMIMPFGKPVHIEVRSVGTVEYHKHISILRAQLFMSGHNKWFAEDDMGRRKVVAASSPSQIPKVSLSPALRSGKLSDRRLSEEKDYSFVYIVQGQNAAERSKAVVCSTLEATGFGMLHEALNGFSIVFSAVFLTSEIPFKGTEGTLHGFAKVESIDGLDENKNKDGGWKRPRIFC